MGWDFYSGKYYGKILVRWSSAGTELSLLTFHRRQLKMWVGRLVWFYGITAFVGYLIVTFPLRPTIRQLLQPFLFLAGRWSTSGSDRGNAHFLLLQEYNRGNRRKKRTNEQTLGVNSRAEGELCNTLHSW